jgi:hypothetical protein
MSNLEVTMCRVALIMVAIVGSVACTDEQMSEDEAELALSLAGDSSEFAEFRVTILDAATGNVVVKRTLDLDTVIGPIMNRLVAVLPADKPLLVDVVATNANNEVIGSGGSLVTLPKLMRTAIHVAVIAHPGAPGLLDATFSPAHYPTRDYLLVDPPSNVPGGQQTLEARLRDHVTGLPLTDGFFLILNGVVAPMFSVGPNAMTASWTWEGIDQGPIALSVFTGYVDSEGRGWIGSAVAELQDNTTPVDIEIGWKGVIPASGKLKTTNGRWLLGYAPGDAQKGESPAVAIATDADNDGVFIAIDRVVMPIEFPLFFVAANPTGIVMPADVAGIIFDSNGDGSRDRMLGIGGNGALQDIPWPIVP